MVLLFLGLQKNKPNRRAQGLCFCFFLGLPKKQSQQEGTRVVFFVFVVLSKKNNQKGTRVAFLLFWCCQKKQIQQEGTRVVFLVFVGLPKKNKSNTRAEIEGNVCLRETNRAHAGGSHPVPPSGSSGSGAYFIHQRFGSVRFPNCRFLGGFRFARFGSRFAVRFANLLVMLASKWGRSGKFDLTL